MKSMLLSSSARGMPHIMRNTNDLIHASGQEFVGKILHERAFILSTIGTEKPILLYKYEPLRSNLLFLHSFIVYELSGCNGSLHRLFHNSCDACSTPGINICSSVRLHRSFLIAATANLPESSKPAKSKEDVLDVVQPFLGVSQHVLVQA